jgi:uncharacterized protein
MSGLPISFAGADLIARPSGALWWPKWRALIVADLHLGKSERMARRGGPLLPPFEGEETLARLQGEIGTLSPRVTFLLGDTFDDDASTSDVLDPLRLRTDLHLLSGNHDRASGTPCLRLDGIALRHQADPDDVPDLSGHFHPKLTVAGRRYRAFLIGQDHLILPAFGTYTGGMDANDRVLTDLIGPGRAVVVTGRAAHLVPYGVTPVSRGNA